MATSQLVMINGQDSWRLIRATREITNDANALWRPPEEATRITHEHVLANSIVRGSRTYIERIVFQINATYDASCFDACSIMIRKLLETLIIEVFEHFQADQHIKNSQGNFMRLSEMIDQLLKQPLWNLGRETKANLPKLKIVGDRSAHNRRYTAHRSDIDKVIDSLRIVVQELLSLAGLK